VVLVILYSFNFSSQIECKYLDLIIRIWRVFPYAVESLLVVRSIFCALPPVHLAVIRNSLAVAFRDESTLSHSLMVYNLENNGKMNL
jgi:hypothetical protein